MQALKSKQTGKKFCRQTWAAICSYGHGTQRDQVRRGCHENSSRQIPREFICIFRRGFEPHATEQKWTVEYEIGSLALNYICIDWNGVRIKQIEKKKEGSKEKNNQVGSQSTELQI